MLRIDEISLITFGGFDYQRLLVFDDSLDGDISPCDYCIYDAGIVYGDVDDPLFCFDYHSCGDSNHYFLLRPCPVLNVEL